MLKVIGLGDNVVDKYVNTGVMYPGGNALNFSVFAKTLGADSSYMGVFGTDRAAAVVQQTLESHGVAMMRCRTVEGENGYACVTLKGGDRCFLCSNKGGVARTHSLKLDEDDLKCLSGFDLICTNVNSHIDGELAALDGLSAKKAYDFSSHFDDDRFAVVCPHVDFAVISCGASPLETVRDLCARAHRCGSPFVLASRGGSGAVFSAYEKFFSHPAHTVEAIDTLGAGDSYLTCFLLQFVEWMKDHRPAQVSESELSIVVHRAMEQASLFAASVCMVHGAFGEGVHFDDDPVPAGDGMAQKEQGNR